MSKTILITGASGFIGSWLAEESIKCGYKIIGIDLRAPLKPSIWSGFFTGSCEHVDLPQIFSHGNICAVFHLAGGAAVAASVADPFGDFSSLMPGTARLATTIAKLSPKTRIFLFSSAAVYGNPSRLPITAETALCPISPYGVHKALAESMLLHYSRVLPLPVTILRIFSVYGPGLRKQLIWDIIQKTQAAQGEGRKSIMLWGTGNESRDFIYVSDICRAALHLFGRETGAQFEIFNLGSGVESTVKQVALGLVEALHAQVCVEFNGQSPQGDPVNWRADVSPLAASGYTCSVSLESGLNEVAAWASMIRQNS